MAFFYSFSNVNKNVFRGLAFLFLSQIVVFQQGAYAEYNPTSVKSNVKDILIPPLRALKLQKPKRVQLKNGMVFLLQPDSEIPLIHTRIIVKGGTDEEPASQVGLVTAFANTWIKGGSKTQTGDALDDFFESRGIDASSVSSSEYVALRFGCLKTDFDEASKRIFQLLRQPEFREDKISLFKKQLLTQLATLNDDSGSIALRAASRLVFGEKHPYAREPNYNTIAAIHRADLLTWHKQHVFPNRIIIGVVGDFNIEEMEKKLRDEFEAWPTGPSYVAPKLSFTQTKPGVYFVPKEDVNQSAIRLVQLGQTRRNPDFYAIEVLNQILGSGSLTGRLFESIRTKQGLAYSVGGGIGSGWQFPETFMIALGTKSQNTGRAIQAVYQELEELLQNPPLQKEVNAAKDQILHSFIFTFADRTSILSNQLTLEFYGYPPDWFEKYPQEIKKVTVGDIKRVIQKYIKPKEFSLLVVGKEKDFEKPLSALGMGNVTILDTRIQTTPPPKSK